MQKKTVSEIFFLVTVFVFSLFSVGYAETLTPESKIMEVTVYPDSALVKRMASLNLSKGEHQIIFSDLIPDVQENSLTVSGKGEADVKIFGVQLKREYLTVSPSEEIKKLQADMEAINDQVDGKNNALNILNDEKDFLDSIRLTARDQIPKDLITKLPNITDLDSLSKFLVAKLGDNQSKKQEINLAIRELNRQKEALERKLQEVNTGNRKMQRNIIVDLEAEKSGKFDLTVSYLVRGVSWNPVYDARTSFSQNKVELISFGVVRQSTGESWEDIQLFLSTAKPSIGGKMPELPPWYLRPYEYNKPQTLAMGGMAGRKKSAGDELVGVQYEPYYLESNFNVSRSDTSQLSAKEATIAYTTVEQKGTAVVYEVKRKVTIKADGSEQKVPIVSQNLNADFQYAATPKLSSSAYLMTKVKNSKDGQLLPGVVNIFSEGDYIGASSIAKSIGAEESFDLYLGIDEGITIKRKKLEEKTDETWIANIPSPNKTTTFSYKLIVENYKDRKIKFNLFDQIPVSEDTRISIKNVKFSVEPTKNNYLDRKGVMRWDFELNPKEIKEITLTYAIEHPRDLNVSGLE